MAFIYHSNKYILNRPLIYSFKKVLFTNNHILNEKNKENNIELSNEIEFEYLNKIKKILNYKINYTSMMNK